MAMDLILLCRYLVQTPEQSLDYSIQIRKCCPFALSVLYPIPMTYKKGVNRR